MTTDPNTRIPVQPSRELGKPAGTIAWSEHLIAWGEYDRKWRCGQSAERVAERGGFGYCELLEFLCAHPETWEPR